MGDRLIQNHPDPEYPHNLIAIGYNGSNVVSYGFNSEKTHPIMKRIAEKYHIEKMYDHSQSCWLSESQHAEINCFVNANDSDTIDTVAVFRQGESSDFLNSEPCNICRKFLEDQDVETLIYVRDGKVIEERI